MTEFVDGWFLGHTLGEGAYGEYVWLFALSLSGDIFMLFICYLYLSRGQVIARFGDPLFSALILIGRLA